MFDSLYGAFAQIPITPVIAVSGFLLAVFTFLWRVSDGRYRQIILEDKEWVEQLRLSLEHAFISVVSKNKEDDTPIKDPLSWNVAARHITRYWKMKKNLKTDIYKTLCNEHEEYWRHKFYLLLKRIGDKKFFAKTEILYMQRFHPERIDTKSAAIVYAFSQWKDDDPDPIDDYSLEDLIVNHNLFSRQCRPFKEFVEEVNPNIADNLNESKGNPV